MRKKENKKSKVYSRYILIILVIIGAAIGWYKYLEAQRYETTDDAQMESDIAPVSSKISGYIAKVFFDDNEKVKKGDTLVILDPGDLQIKVEQAQAALENAKAMLFVAQSTATLTKKESETDSIKIEEIKVKYENAKKDYERYKNLIAVDATTDIQFQNAKTYMETLKKQLEIARQTNKVSHLRTIVSNEQIKVAESIVKQRQADLDFAKLQLSYTFIIAPIDGVVSKRNAVAGQLIQAGQPLCSITSDKQVWIVANFKETQIKNIKPGMKVEVEIDAFPDEKLVGRISSFSPATGSRFSLIPPDNATGNFVKVVQRIPIKIELNKNNKHLAELKPGMSVFVKVIVKG